MDIHVYSCFMCHRVYMFDQMPDTPLCDSDRAAMYHLTYHGTLADIILRSPEIMRFLEPVGEEMRGMGRKFRFEEKK